jgi:ribulose-phosphate 3-epimerase
VNRLKDLILKRNSTALIEIDGGVTSANARQLYDAGVDVLVAGSYVFNAPNPIEAIQMLKKA